MPLVLWRNDLEEIVSILGVKEGKVEIVASEYSFENVAELLVAARQAKTYHCASPAILNQCPCAMTRMRD